MKRHSIEEHVFPETIQNKRVLIRMDLNGSDEEGYKIKRYSQEIKRYNKLAKNRCSVVLLTHYGRKGSKDFKESLEDLARALEKSSKVYVNYVDDVAGKKVIEKTGNPGVYLLNNVRLHPDETNPQFNKLIEFFATNFDTYINDAPAVAHRPHSSVVLGKYMESYFGRIFAEEINLLDKVKKSDKVLVWGGAKLDKAKYIVKLLENDWEVLLGGVPAIKYKEGKMSNLEKYASQIVAPVDFIEKNGEVADIGPKTLELYTDILKDKNAVFSGPMGKYEEGFEKTSIDIMKASSVILGGHSGNIAYKYGLSNILTSGGSALAYLADEPLPGIDSILHNKNINF